MVASILNSTLDASGFLGASPDGLVGSDSVIEVKCPYKHRNAESLRDVLKDKNYFCYFNGENMVINCNHSYYHQAQGHMYLTGRDTCYYVIWTPKCAEMFAVEKDPSWAENLGLLRNFIFPSTFHIF